MIGLKRIPLQELGLAVAALGMALVSGSATRAVATAQVPHAADTQDVGLTPGELRATQAFDAAKDAGPPELYAFLKPFPKGADLHMHLSGAIYAETFIAEAAVQGLCIASVDHGMPPVPEGQDALRFVAPTPAAHGHAAACAPGQVLAADALKDQKLYDDLVDSFSMRAFMPTEGIDGHDQFFATFERYGGLKDYSGEWLDQVATRAASQNEQYLEVMQTPDFKDAAEMGHKLGWPADAEHSVSREELGKLLQELSASPEVQHEAQVDARQLARAKASRDAIERCGASPDRNEPNACSVKIHWIYQVLRGFPPQQVFAQTVLAFMVASADPDVAGLNFVMPEDGYLSMRDYHLQMQMLDYLHSVYPKVHITLHAGELAFGMVPPEGLSFHIRQAIDLGHAERIGHGVDVLYEDSPAELLKQMAAQHIMVEINLTSNAVILGIKGKQHPLHAYMAAHVPWALSTDDEGVARIDLTHEYVRGALEQGLTYLDLKQSARTSLEHAFLHGQSLWAAPNDFTRLNPVCAAAITAASTAAAACAAFLQANEKAAEQWELERRFAVFEAGQR